MPYIIDDNTAKELGLPPGTHFLQGAGLATRRGVSFIRFVVDGRLIEIDRAKVMWVNELGGTPIPLLSPAEKALLQEPPLPPALPSQAELIEGIPAPVWAPRKGRYHLNSVDEDPDAYRPNCEPPPGN